MFPTFPRTKFKSLTALSIQEIFMVTYRLDIVRLVLLSNLQVLFKIKDVKGIETGELGMDNLAAIISCTF